MSARSFDINNTKTRQGNILVKRNEDSIEVILHATTVVKRLNDATLILDSGGWRTQTTKRAINRALMLMGTGLTVAQKDFEWYVLNNRTEKEMIFTDGVILTKGKL